MKGRPMRWVTSILIGLTLYRDAAGVRAVSYSNNFNPNAQML